MRADYVIGIAILIGIVLYQFFNIFNKGDKMEDEEEDSEDENTDDEESGDEDSEEDDTEEEDDEEEYQCTTCGRDVDDGEYIELPDKDEDGSSFVFCKKCVDKAYPREKGPDEAEINILVNQKVQEILRKKAEKEPAQTIDESEFDTIL